MYLFYHQHREKPKIGHFFYMSFQQHREGYPQKCIPPFFAAAMPITR
jgi:hypothetical protein